MMMEGTCGNRLVHSPLVKVEAARAGYPVLWPSIWVLNITQDEDSTDSLDNLFQYMTTQDPPWAFSASGWRLPALSASPHMKDATLLKEPSSWPCTGLAPVSPYLSCTGEPQAALSALDVASPMRRGEITSLLCLLVMYFFSVFTLLSTGAPRSLSVKLLYSLSAPGLYRCTHAVIALQRQDFAHPFDELCGVPGSAFLQPAVATLLPASYLLAACWRCAVPGHPGDKWRC